MTSEPDNHQLAEERTDWAEDRTLLANERTFAGWMRTGLAAVGIGAGFQALFGKLEPGYLARSIATVFVLTGIFIFVVAARSAANVCERLKAHAARPLAGLRTNVIATLFVIASIALLVGIWAIALP
jgi:putative membrane protein